MSVEHSGYVPQEAQLGHEEFIDACMTPRERAAAEKAGFTFEEKEALFTMRTLKELSTRPPRWMLVVPNMAQGYNEKRRGEYKELIDKIGLDKFSLDLANFYGRKAEMTKQEIEDLLS